MMAHHNNIPQLDYAIAFEVLSYPAAKPISPEIKIIFIVDKNEKSNANVNASGIVLLQVYFIDF